MSTRILHLSDLHIGMSRNKEEDNNFQVIVDSILKKGQNDWKENKPLILLTGDIVDDGEEDQFKTARDYLKKLHDAGFAIRIIPGNHDYGKNGNDANIESFNMFKRYFSHFQEMEFPLKESINDHFLLGLNSMEVYTASNFAEGRLGDAQIDKACAYLTEHKERPENKKMIVCLHHHPFLFPDEGILKRIGEHVGHRLEDGRDFMKKIKHLKVDMLLFGHEHRHLMFKGTRLNQEKGYNIPWILSSGKSTEKSREFNVLKNGTTDKPAPTIIAEVADDPTIGDYWDLEEKIREKDREKLARFPYGLFGRLIEIDDSGEINTHTINFLSS